MKMLRLTTMWMLLMAAVQMSAANQYIYAEPVDVEAGQEAEIVVKMDFDTDVEVGCWHFDMQLPEGVKLVTPEKPKKSCTLSSEVYDMENDPESYFDVTTQSNGNLLILFVTGLDDILNRFPVKSTHCELVRVTITSDVAQTVEPIISNVSILGVGNEFLIVDDVDKRPDHENVLYVEGASALVGSDFTLSVKLRNKLDIEGFGFDLVLPSGMSVVTDAEGKPMVSLSEERTTSARTNTFEVRKLANSLNDVIRVVAASSNGSAIAAGDGEVCQVRVRVGTGMKEGKYYAQLVNASLADSEARSHEVEQQSFTITVLSLNLGDANGDGNVTVADMTAIAHHVMGRTPEGFSAKAADANGDGQVNVADYTAVAHLLLYGTIERPAAARGVMVFADQQDTDVSALDNTVYIVPMEAVAGQELTLSVKMKNSVEAEGFQFCLSLPEGFSVVRDNEGFAEATLSTERTTAARTNTFATTIMPDGTLRVMGASTNGSAISAGDGEVCKIRVRVADSVAEGSYTLTLSDVAISDTSAKSHDVKLVETTVTVNSTQGIETLTQQQAAKAQPVYDLQGRRLENVPQKGLYIRDGRKFVK